MKKLLIITTILILIFSGCEKRFMKDSDLVNSTWVLSYIQDTKSNVITNYPVDAARKISIVFNNSSDNISFSGICNAGSGKYSCDSQSGELKVTDLGTTMIGCKYVEWETYTIQNLYSATSYKISGASLTINSGGNYNLYFTRY